MLLTGVLEHGGTQAVDSGGREVVESHTDKFSLTVTFTLHDIFSLGICYNNRKLINTQM